MLANTRRRSLRRSGSRKSNPTNAARRTRKGVVYLAMRDNARARASFEKAVSLNPGFGTAVFNLARLDTLEKNYEGARSRYQAIVAKDAQNEAALLALAELLAVTKAPPEEVRAAIERAVAANPASAQPRLALIAFHVSRKEWAAAVVAGQAAQVAVPDSADILEALGVAQFASGEPNQAIATLKRAVRIRPDNVQSLLVLAELQSRQKDWEGAIQSLRSVVDLQPASSPGWILLAGVYDEAGRLPGGNGRSSQTSEAIPRSRDGVRAGRRTVCAPEKVARSWGGVSHGTRSPAPRHQLRFASSIARRRRQGR